MMKRMTIVLAVLSLGACTTVHDREAVPGCFKTDGSIHPSCEFKPLTGQPAVFTFLDNTNSEMRAYV